MVLNYIWITFFVVASGDRDNFYALVASVTVTFFVCFLFVAPYATYAPHPETDRLPPPRSIRPVSISVKRHVLSFRGPHAPDPRPARSG